MVGNIYTVEQQWIQPLKLAQWPCPLLQHCQKDHERIQEQWREGDNVSGCMDQCWSDIGKWVGYQHE